MRCPLPICVTLFLFSCSAQVTTDHAPGLDSLKFQREVDSVAVVNPEISYEFLCKGNEPFWQVTISKAAKLIDLYEPMEQRTTRFTYSEPRIKDSILEFVSGNGKDAILITLKKENCSDGMSEKKYEYSAEVHIAGKQLKGCANSN